MVPPRCMLKCHLPFLLHHNPRPLNPGNESAIFRTRTRTWATSSDQGYVFLPGATVLITLSNGIVTGFDWAKTSCALSGCSCIDTGTSYELCGYTCPDSDPSGLNCNIVVRVAWTGTDAGGHMLSSSCIPFQSFI